MKAAVNASVAVAIAILSIAPVRLNNLIKIKLEENLIKPGGTRTDLIGSCFPKEDVKNRVQLQHKILPEVGDIDRRIHQRLPPSSASAVQCTVAFPR